MNYHYLAVACIYATTLSAMQQEIHFDDIVRKGIAEGCHQMWEAAHQAHNTDELPNNAATVYYELWGAAENTEQDFNAILNAPQCAKEATMLKAIMAVHEQDPQCEDALQKAKALTQQTKGAWKEYTTICNYKTKKYLEENSGIKFPQDCHDTKAFMQLNKSIDYDDSTALRAGALALFVPEQKHLNTLHQKYNLH